MPDRFADECRTVVGQTGLDGTQMVMHLHLAATVYEVCNVVRRRKEWIDRQMREASPEVATMWKSVRGTIIDKGDQPSILEWLKRIRNGLAFHFDQQHAREAIRVLHRDESTVPFMTRERTGDGKHIARYIIADEAMAKHFAEPGVEDLRSRMGKVATLARDLARIIEYAIAAHLRDAGCRGRPM
jgi:hypothetical protein